MKRGILIILLACLLVSGAYALTETLESKPTSLWWTGSYRDKAWRWAKEVENIVEEDAILFNPTDTVPTASEGRMYYNDTANAWYGYNGSAWTQFGTASGNSLDGAYNLGNEIVVDGTALTLTVNDAVNNSALLITNGEITNDNDAMQIAHSGAGDAIQVTVADADGVAMRLIGAASQTTSLSYYDASTSNWDGADNIGMLHMNADDPFIHAGASMLQIVNSGTPITAAEGFLARFVSTGTAATDGVAVEIEVPATQPALASNGIVQITGQDQPGAALVQITGNDATSNADAVNINNEGTGDALQITCDDADSVALNLIAAADQTTSLAKVDAATNNWDGADNVGMLHISADDPVVHTGASLLNITQSGQPISGGEGFLARFIASGTARTNAHAVEIETTNTQPALQINNKMTIAGADSAGVLLDIDGIDTTGNSDTVQINHSGTGDAVQITCTETDSVALNLVAAASQTTSVAKVDAATSNWDGADNVGMLHIVADDPLVHTGASLLNVTQSGTPIASAEGFLARFIQSGTARTNATAVEIEVKATQPALAVNGITKINGQDAAGATLFQVAGVGASGNADAMLISNTGSGNCLQVTPGETDSGGVNVTSLAASTVPMVNLDGATNNWDGADNIGQLTLTQDDAVVHTGATQLMVHNTGTTVAAAEGFLARFVQDTGAAVTDAYAVEIETTNTTPALYLNNQMTISAADSAGTLFDITAIDTTGDSDTMTITHGGDGDAIQITVSEPAGQALNAIADAAQTDPVITIDGTTGAYLGAQNVGMLHMTSDGSLAHVDSSLLYIANTGVPQDDARGTCLRIVDSGNAAAGTAGYSAYIKTTDATMEALYVDDGNVKIDDNLEIGGTTTFTGGQTRQYHIRLNDIDLDGTNPPTLTSLGTDGQWRSDVLQFDSNPGGNDDVCYIQWIVPAGYVADSADLHVYWTHSDAEDAADECVIDGTVDACAAGETTDTAGTGMAAVTSVIADASASAGKLIKTSLDIEVEDIAVDDMVTIMFFFDESACLMATSGTADVHYFTITYESTE